VRAFETQAKLNNQTPSPGAMRRPLPRGEASEQFPSPGGRGKRTFPLSQLGEGPGVRAFETQAKLNNQTPSPGAMRRPLPRGEASEQFPSPGGRGKRTFPLSHRERGQG